MKLYWELVDEIISVLFYIFNFLGDKKWFNYFIIIVSYNKLIVLWLVWEGGVDVFDILVIILKKEMVEFI